MKSTKLKQNKQLFVIFERSHSRGFTLVETLVAVSILSLSILAGFTAVQSSLRNSGLSKDQVTAFFLAQEAIEFIKNIRDENALTNLGGTPTNWLNRLAEDASDPCWFGNVCRVDPYQYAISSASAIAFCGTTVGSCPVLNQSISGSTIGLFGYTAGWIATRFKREIQFQSISSDQVYITVTITWNMGAIPQTFQVRQLLFNHE